MINESPLFGVTPGGLAFMMNVHYLRTTKEPTPLEIARAFEAGEIHQIAESGLDNRLGMGIQKIAKTSGLLVGSIEEIEEYVLDLHPRTQAELLSSMLPQDGMTIGQVMMCMIRRSCSRIAQRTRRGSGNVLLVGPKLFDVITETLGQEFVSVEETRVGRWTYKGIAHRTLSVYVSDVLPEDEIFTAYVGSNTKLIDGPVGCLQDDGIYLIPRPISTSVLGQSKDFVSRMRVDVAVD